MKQGGILMLFCCFISLALMGCTMAAKAKAGGPPQLKEIRELPVLNIAPESWEGSHVAAVYLGRGATRQERVVPDEKGTTYFKGRKTVRIEPGSIDYFGSEPREMVGVEWDAARTSAVRFLKDSLGVPEDAVGPFPSREPTLGPGTHRYVHTFRWDRRVHGVPVAGAQWIDVHVGGKGEVAWSLRRWHRIRGQGEMVRIAEPTKVIDPKKTGEGWPCPDCSPKPNAIDIARARLVYHVRFNGPVTQMVPAWEVTVRSSGGQERYYYHAGTGEPLGW